MAYKEFIDDFDDVIDVLSDTLDDIDEIDIDFNEINDRINDNYVDEEDECEDNYCDEDNYDDCEECDDEDDSEYFVDEDCTECCDDSCDVVDAGDTDGEYIEKLEAVVNTTAPLEPESKTSRKVKADVFESGEDNSPDSNSLILNDKDNAVLSNWRPRNSRLKFKNRKCNKNEDILDFDELNNEKEDVDTRTYLESSKRLNMSKFKPLKKSTINKPFKGKKAVNSCDELTSSLNCKSKKKNVKKGKKSTVSCKNVKPLESGKYSRGKRAVVAGANNFASSIKGFITLYAYDDDIYKFEDWYNDHIDMLMDDYPSFDFDNATIEEVYDEFGRMYDEQLSDDYQFLVNKIQDDIDEINRNLEMYEIQIKSGYYEGFSVCVDEKSEWYTNDKFVDKVDKHEKRRINKLLMNLAEEYGLKATQYTLRSW